MRLMVFAAATDKIVGLHLVRLSGLDWTCTDIILEPQIERFVVVAAMWDLCETWVFLPNVCPRVLLLSPEVRWSEMEWLVSWFWAPRLSVRCDMNGLFYTSIVYIEMNVVVSTSIVRRFEGCFLPWVHCYIVEVQY